MTEFNLRDCFWHEQLRPKPHTTSPYSTTPEYITTVIFYTIKCPSARIETSNLLNCICQMMEMPSEDENTP